MPGDDARRAAEGGACVQEPKDITRQALSGECGICEGTVDLFLQIIGAEAGGMGLRCMASGGVFVAGGIPPRILPKVEAGGLRAAFLNEEGRFGSVLRQFPLFVLRGEAGLEGTFQYALTVAQHRR